MNAVKRLKSSIFVLMLLLLWLAGTFNEGSGQDTSASEPEVLPDNAMGTGFTTRYAGNNPYETAVTLSQVTFPASSHANQPGAVILVRPDRKEELMCSVSIIHHPIDAPILFVDHDRLPPETKAAIERIHPEGIAFDNGVQAIVVGNVSDQVIREVESLDLKVRHIQGEDPNDPASLAAAVDDYRASIHADHPDTVVVASLDAPDFAIPALSFAAHMPTGFTFVTRDSIPDATRGMLSRRYGPAYIYLMGPESAVSEEVARELSSYGHVQRLASPDPYALSAYFAGYRDSGQNFGWWIGRTPRDFGWGIAEPGHNFIFVNPDAWAEGLAATVLSHRGKHAAMLFVQNDSIPEPVNRYLNQTVRPRPSAPRDQLFNHGLVIGNTSTISPELQGEIDGLLRPKAVEGER